MRIGIVSQSFFPARGGVAENALHTARELQRRGHEVTVITSRFTPFDDDCGLDVRRIGHDLTIPANGAFVNLTVGLFLRRRLQAIEAERRFDVIQIHSPLEPILPMLAVQTLQAPKVGLFHTYVSSGKVLPYDLFRGFVTRIGQRLTIRAAVSEAAARFIASYFSGDYRIVPNGVDVRRFSPDVRPLERWPAADFRIVFVGRMDPRKGVKYLLKAFSDVLPRLPRARLIIVGSGILQKYYQHYLPSARRSRVSFEGFASADELPRYYRTADVFCAPALGGESFGIVLLEALASGTPVVASDIPGYNSIISDGVDGYLVPPKDSAAIANAIVRLEQQPAVRASMAVRGREKSLQFSWERVTDKLEQVFEETRCLASR